MPSFDDLCRRGCMGDVVQLVGQIPSSLAMRSSVDLDDGSLEMAVLWGLLAWGRKFWTACLEELGVDVSQLARELDGLLGEKRPVSGSEVRMTGERPSWSAEARRRLDRSLDAILDRAGREASSFGHDYLGNEHLLLAILAEADGRLAALLSRHEIRYQDVKKAVTDALARVDERRFVRPPRKPWPARLDDTPATGVPRRFSMTALFAMMTLYAVVFAVMQSVDAGSTVFIVIAVLLTGVGIGQTLLFDGKFPRVASVCTGAVLFPLEIVAAIVYHNLSSPSSVDLGIIILATVISVPAGGLFGYLAGGLAGGVFVLLELIAKETQSKNDGQNRE